MTEVTNESRADAAYKGVEAYAIAKEGRAEYDDAETMASDLLTDLLHWFNQNGTSIGYMILRSLSHVGEEIREEDENGLQLDVIDELEALNQLAVDRLELKRSF